ncbi:MAG: Fic family protein [Bacteroidetes bacterium]|nr:Fic family protein [Bacteroidota bacterium]
MKFDPNIPFNLPELPGSVNIGNNNLTDILIGVNRELAELKVSSGTLPNPLLLLSPAIIKESLASSIIENINTTLEDVLQNELFPEPERKEQDKEVLRYRDAVLNAFNELRKFPLSNRIILGIHKKLIPGRDTGYRKTQNKIENSLTKEILYTPPPANKIQELISNWEKFVNSTDIKFDPVLKTVIAHYQFEAIHPFGDGNGRTGRILMLMELVQDGILKYPILYISGYINKNRDRYYEVIRNVTIKNEWLQYSAYMLNTIYHQAVETKSLIFKMNNLNNVTKEKVKKLLPKLSSPDLIDSLFAFPIITPVKLGDMLNVHYTTASRYLKQLSRVGILKENVKGKYHLYINFELMKILNKI